MASSTVNEDGEMEDEAPPELNILTSETIRMAVREINRSLPRSPKTRIKLLFNLDNFFRTIADLIQCKDPRVRCRLLQIIHDLQDMVVGITNLIISLSTPSALKQISHIYETVYNMGAYLENIIIEVYDECQKRKLTFSDIMRDFLYSLMKLSCENGDSWLYSVLISPIVVHVLNAFWRELDEERRTDWCYDVEDLMIPLAKATFTCGDFYCQHYLVTIFNYWVRWAIPGKAVPIINSVFHCVEKDARKDLLRLENTEQITRNFLNALNTSSKGPRTVIPISCLYMFVCNTEIRPPEHEVHRETDFWVDFSIVSGRLHAYYSIPDAQPLASLSIRRDQIDSVCLNWVVHDSQVEDPQQDGDTQSTFAKDEKVLFFHIVLSVDFDAVTSDIESFTGKGYRSIYLVFRSGELVEKLMKDMGYSVHECGSMSCQRPPALRRLLATKHKLSYKESWCPDSQITGLDSTMNETRTSNVSVRSEKSPLNVSRTSVTSTPLKAETKRQPSSTPLGIKNRRHASTPCGKENNRAPSTPYRKIRNETPENRSISSFISISVSSQEQDENSPTDSSNLPANISLHKSREISQSVSATVPLNISVNSAPNVAANFSVDRSPNISLNADPNVSANPSPNISLNAGPNASVGPSPNISLNADPNVSIGPSPNISLNADQNVSVDPSPIVSVIPSGDASPSVLMSCVPNVSLNPSPNVLVSDSPNASVYDSPYSSVHASHASAHESFDANDSVHNSPNVSVNDAPKALVHKPSNDVLPDFSDESASTSSTEAINLSPNGSVYTFKGSAISPSHPINLKSFDRSLHVSPNLYMNTSIATSCEEPLPPEAREKFAHLYKHVPFNQRQETPKRVKSSKVKASKLMLVRNSSPKVTAPLQEPITPPVSEIGSPQHNILNLTVGADLDATNASEDEDTWPTTPELSFGEGSDKNEANDDHAISLSPVFGFSRALEARGKSMSPISEHQSFEKYVSAVSEHQSLEESVSEHQSLEESVSEHQSLEKSVSQHHNRSLEKSISEPQNLEKSVSAISHQQTRDKSVSHDSEQSSSAKMNSTTFNRRQRRMTCYSNSFAEWMNKTKEKSKSDNYDPYDLLTSSEMDDYRDMLFPKAKTYGGSNARKRKNSTRQGGIAKKGRTVKTTVRGRQRFNLMRFKNKDLRKESNSHSLELEFKGDNPRGKNSFFKRRD